MDVDLIDVCNVCVGSDWIVAGADVMTGAAMDGSVPGYREKYWRLVDTAYVRIYTGSIRRV